MVKTFHLEKKLFITGGVKYKTETKQYEIKNYDKTGRNFNEKP